MRGIELSAFLAGDVAALVSHGPINAAVRTEEQAVHIVTGIGDVAAETSCDEFFHIGDTISVDVFEAPDVRDGGNVDPAIEVHDPGGDAGYGRVEAVRENRNFVSHAVTICVAELVDSLLRDREVLPVNRTVLVVILESAARGLQFAGRQFMLKKRQLLLRGSQSDVVGYPYGMLTDVEVAGFTSRSGCHVDVASFIHRDRGGVRHVELA